MVICLERGADLYMAQLMPLPLTVSGFSKIQIGFTFLVPAHPGSPEQRAVKRVCACVIGDKSDCEHIRSSEQHADSCFRLARYDFLLVFSCLGRNRYRVEPLESAKPSPRNKRKKNIAATYLWFIEKINIPSLHSSGEPRELSQWLMSRLS